MASNSISTTGEADGDSADQTALRILVVEDDPDALATAQEMLQALGHWTAGVKSAEVARDRFIEGAFDVLMTDIGLPALSGIDLVEILQANHKLRVIFATGQARPAEPMPDTIWLQKPFGFEELAEALRGIQPEPTRR